MLFAPENLYTANIRIIYQSRNFWPKKALFSHHPFVGIAIENDKNFADLFLICTFVYAIFY